jgi:hypothetical protein
MNTRKDTQQKARAMDKTIISQGTPDFRSRFSAPPKGPDIKGGLVQLILEQRDAS